MKSEIDRLPFGLEWEVTPASWHFDGNAARVRASGQTDFEFAATLLTDLRDSS
jgi:hypothetical protein